MMVVRKLLYLIALQREGNYSRAARACHVSQPTLSESIRKLERQSGAILVKKRGRRYQGLTKEGHMVAAFAVRMAIEYEQLEMELAKCSLEKSDGPRDKVETNSGLFA